MQFEFKIMRELGFKRSMKSFITCVHRGTMKRFGVRRDVKESIFELLLSRELFLIHYQ